MNKEWNLVVMVRDRQINAWKKIIGSNNSDPAKNFAGFACLGEEGLVISNIDVILPNEVVADMQKLWEKNFSIKNI